MAVDYPRGSGKTVRTPDTPPNQAKPGPPLKMVPPAGVDEEAVQAVTIRVLERAGFIVLQTSVRYHNQECPACHKWFRPRGGTGTTPGVPDLLVTREDWPPGLWLGIEMKDADGGLTAAQVLLHAQQRVFIARSPQMAVSLAEAATALFLVYDLEPPELDREAIDKARARVQKAKEAAQIRAAQAKVRR